MLSSGFLCIQWKLGQYAAGAATYGYADIFCLCRNEENITLYSKVSYGSCTAF